MPQLIQFSGGRSIVHELRKGSTVIGRSVKADVRIGDRAASRAHFRIESADAGYKIVDLDSQNGTFLNGAQVHGESVLKIGDRIDVGLTTFFFGKVVKPGHANRDDGIQESSKTQKYIKPLDRSRRKIEVRRLLKEREQLLRMQRVNSELNSEKDLPALLSGIMDAILELTAAERGFIILGGDEGGDLEFAAARNINKEEVKSPEFQISRSIARRVLQTGAGVLTQNAEDDERFRKIASVRDRKLRSIICLPLSFKGETLGVIYIDNPFQKGIFGEDDLQMLRGFADQAAVAIRNAQLFEAASKDSLTGLWGHPYFEKAVERELSAGSGPVSVIIADLDMFKGINDIYGHGAGNAVLVELAGLISGAATSRGGIAARFGGDEFELLLPSTAESEAVALAESLRKEVEARQFPASGKNLRITLSAGVAASGEGGDSAADLIRKADESLYSAKRRGRNRTEASGAQAGADSGFVTGSPDIDRLAFSRDGMMMMGCIARLLEAELDFGKVADILLGAVMEGIGAAESAVALEGPWAAEPLSRGRADPTAPPGPPSPELLRALKSVAEAAAVEAGTDTRPTMLPENCIGAPLRGSSGRVIGAIAALRPGDRLFVNADAELLSLFAAKAGRPIENALRFGESQGELDRIRRAFRDGVSRLKESFSYAGMVGTSREIRSVVEMIEKVRDSDLPVLIVGESGTGKELAARALHFRSPRKDRPFISENCAAIADSLLESELFGHVKGAFTGADKDHAGLFELADSGTLFLDEIGDMSLAMQTRLLRVLQEGELRPVGGTSCRKVDVRVVAATNRDLSKMAADGGFRSDLFYRLNAVSIRMPALRERREDIPLLAEYFLARAAENEGGQRKHFTAEAMEALCAHRWPGNVRELQNEILRSAVLCSETAIGREWLSARVVEDDSQALPDVEETVMPLREAVAETEKAMIRRALDQSGGNKTHAAKMLGLSWLGLQKKMDRLGLS